VVQTFCTASDPAKLPVKRLRPKITQMADDRLLIVRRGKILLTLSKGPRWKGFWVFPPANRQSSGEIVHQSTYPITRYRMTLTLRHARSFELPDEPAEWIALAELAALPMPAPYRKALKTLNLNSGDQRP
jgi:A/G-specific adenine glycosylase